MEVELDQQPASNGDDVDDDDDAAHYILCEWLCDEEWKKIK